MPHFKGSCWSLYISLNYTFILNAAQDEGEKKKKKNAVED